MINKGCTMILVKESTISPESFNKLRIAVGWEEHNEKDISLALKNTLFVVIAKETQSNQIIGMGRIIGDVGLFYYIQDIIVIPEYQNQGVGMLIMNKIMDYINHNMKNGLFIGLMAAKGKEAFYEKYGFIKRPNDECGSGMYLEMNKE